MSTRIEREALLERVLATNWNPESGYVACRNLPDGRHLCVMPLTYGRARLTISLDGSHEGSYEDGY